MTLCLSFERGIVGACYPETLLILNNRRPVIVPWGTSNKWIRRKARWSQFPVSGFIRTYAVSQLLLWAHGELQEFLRCLRTNGYFLRIPPLHHARLSAIPNWS